MDDSISLNTVYGDGGLPVATPADSSYNYNSGVPTSPPPSFRSRTSSIAFPSVHTNSNGMPSDFSTVQLTPGSSQRTVTARGNGNGSDGDEQDSEALIRAMSKRIERLEESIGRLLMERESRAAENDQPPATHTQRCCISIPQPENPGDAELQMRSGDCCVSIVPRSSPKERMLYAIIRSVFAAMILGILWTVLIAMMRKDKKQ